jgi:hypothetical protein
MPIIKKLTNTLNFISNIGNINQKSDKKESSTYFDLLDFNGVPET